MSRSVIANKHHEAYLQNLSKTEKFAYGVIIGQHEVQDRDYVVHLARTPQHEEQDVDEENVPIVASTGKQIDSQLLVNHALSVTRMIPASFYVLGIFVVSDSNMIQEEVITDALRNVYEILAENKQICGVPEAAPQLIYLSYDALNSKIICRLYDIKQKSAAFEDIDWKFIEKSLLWQKVETNYEVEEIFPLITDAEKIDVESNFYNSLTSIGDQISQSVVFIQNESVDETQLVEAYIKERNAKKEDTTSIHASLYLPAIISPTESDSVEKFNGTFRYTGMICSRIWVYPKTSLKDVQKYVHNDILRSLSSRIQMFCDDQHENIAPTFDNLVVNEPPRRVFFDVPYGSGVQFSEYVFRGESSEIVVEQVKEILDFDITLTQVDADVETLPDFDEDISMFSQTFNTAIGAKSQEVDVNKTMYLLGIGVALLILILSIALHLIFR